jgi:hypothetical protein
MDATRAALEEHWSASERGDTENEHAIYADEAILDYPPSGVRRIVGSGELWVNEVVITYDGVPSYSVSIMEVADEKVVHETRHFGDTFGAPAWRTALADPMPGRHIEKT